MPLAFGLRDYSPCGLAITMLARLWFLDMRDGARPSETRVR
jgi:hypothetical protein